MNDTAIKAANRDFRYPDKLVPSIEQQRQEVLFLFIFQSRSYETGNIFRRFEGCFFRRFRIAFNPSGKLNGCFYLGGLGKADTPYLRQFLKRRRGDTF